ncbi:hypothetical protein A2U01_0116239, partial [Trifolium medium]|nr:hypothetical protein [Trifolium medium]
TFGDPDSQVEDSSAKE